MDVTISDRQLAKAHNTDSKLIQKYGSRRAKLIRQRLDDLSAIDNLEQARHLPGNYHELVANRKGQWACNLDHPYRLILVPHEGPVPTDPDGKYIWIEILGVDVTEIVNYHK